MIRKITFFEGWFWFKFNNLELTLSMVMKFDASVAKELKLKVRKFWGLISYREITVTEVALPLFLPILNIWAKLYMNYSSPNYH